MKRVLVLISLLLISMFCIRTQAAPKASSGKCGQNLNWTLNTDGTLNITGTGDMYDYEDGTAPWYQNQSTSVKKVRVSSGCTHIGNYAFRRPDYAGDITSIYLPYTVKSIGKYAAKGNISLCDLDLGNGVETIGEYAFSGCMYSTGSSKCYVRLPSSLKEIGDYAFGGCSYLDISISDSGGWPSGLKHIGKRAFYNCYKLTGLSLPNGLESIGDEAFYECSSLTYLSIPGNGNLIQVGENVFGSCSSLTEVSFGDELTAIPDNICQNMTELTDITLPSQLKQIGSRAFMGCTALTSFEFPDTLEVIGDSAFENCTALETANLPDSLSVLGEAAFKKCSSLLLISLPSGLECIPKSVFNGCKMLDEVELPNCVAEIDDYAFGGCTILTEINIPESLTRIGMSALASTNILWTVLPDTLTEIGNYAFSGMRNSEFTDVYVPDSVTAIGNGAFASCKNLVSARLPESLTVIPDNCFANCSKLTEVTGPNQVFAVEHGAFQGTGWKTLDCFPGLKTIGEFAFAYSGFRGLFELPDGLEEIGKEAFYQYNAGNCITTVVIPASIRSVGEDAFRGNKVSLVYYFGTEEEWAEVSGGKEVFGDGSYTQVFIDYTCFIQDPFFSSTAATAGKEISLKASGFGRDIQYAWESLKPSETEWESLALTGKEIRFIPSLEMNGTKYRCRITSSNGDSVLSGEVTLRVYKNNKFLIYPAEEDIEAAYASYVQITDKANTVKSLEVAVNPEYTGEVLFSWLKDGEVIPGEESSSFTLSQLGEYHNSELTCHAYDHYGNEWSLNYRISIENAEGWIQYSGKWHYFTGNQAVKGWQEIDGKTYYFDESGAMLTGWQKLDRAWYYFQNSGAMVTGWKLISDEWYYFSNSGVMQTGWQEISGKWYFFNKSGVMQTGWQEISGKWYYFSASGVMQTGWQKISDKWYYFNKSGVMQTGWLNLSGKYYYFTSGGVMVTGWKQIKDVWYFFKPSGVMAAKEWYKGYYLNANGSWTYTYKGSWNKNAKGWWFGDTSGWYAKNCTVTIDDKSYTFDANGYWVK